MSQKPYFGKKNSVTETNLDEVLKYTDLNITLSQDLYLVDLLKIEYRCDIRESLIMRYLEYELYRYIKTNDVEIFSWDGNANTIDVTSYKRIIVLVNNRYMIIRTEALKSILIADEDSKIDGLE